MIVISFFSPFRAFIIHNNIRATTDNHFPHRSIKSNEKKVYDQNAQSGVDDEETSKRKRRQPCPISSCDPQDAEGERGERAVDGRTLSEGENATARTTTTMPISPPPPPPPRPPPQQGNSRVSEGNVNDQDQDFQRQLALAQEEKAEADGPLWSPARCRSFIFNLVYRA